VQRQFSNAFTEEFVTFCDTRQSLCGFLDNVAFSIVQPAK
jgi:hypothetical protein